MNSIDGNGFAACNAGCIDSYYKFTDPITNHKLC